VSTAAISIFAGCGASRLWPEPMRRVSSYDFECHRRLAFWTHVWDLPAATIAELYRERWQIEPFFRWIKENLRIPLLLRHLAERDPRPSCGRPSAPTSPPHLPSVAIHYYKSDNVPPSPLAARMQREHLLISRLQDPIPITCR
jgi:hypothetical protein